MPNHITSEVEIKGTKEQIAKLIKDSGIKLDVDAEENQFDFNAVKKMPPELLHTISPTEIVATQEEADAKNAEYNSNPRPLSDGDEVRYLSEAERDRRMKEYGALNWYDWSNQHWGTKWNAYDVHYTAHNDTTLVIRLDTAWDTPRGIWELLEEQGFTVNGVMYGEMDGFDYIGENGPEAFEVMQTVDAEYIGEA